MKKILVLASALLAAALFFGCSNSSDTIPYIPQVKTELTGKTFRMDDSTGTTIYKFGSTTVTVTVSESVGASTYNTAYELEIKAVLPYSCNSKTKQLLLCANEYQGGSQSIVRGGKSILLQMNVLTTFKDDDDFTKLATKYYETICDKKDADGYAGHIADLVKQDRYERFKDCGYTDPTGATEVTSDVLKLYNDEIASYSSLFKKLSKSYSIYFYEFDGTQLKMEVDEDRVPAGKSLPQLFGSYFLDGGFTLRVKDSEGNVMYFIDTCADFYDDPEFQNKDRTVGYKVESITSKAIKISSKATRSSMYDPWGDFTPYSKTWEYTSTITDSGATFDIPELGGTITVVFATADNVPAFTSEAEVYTLVQ